MAIQSLPPGPRLSVWTTGQQAGALQLARGPYIPATVQDGARIPPAIAAHAITAYTRPGETVLDPHCGAGTVLVEALRAGRHAIGVTGQSRWWPVARANVSAAKHDGAQPDGMVLDRRLATAAPLAGLAGHTALLLTTWHPADADEDEQAPGARLGAVLTRYLPLLRPGGHVVVTVPPHRRRGDLLDLPGRAFEAGRRAGMLPVERCVALLAELRGSRLVVRASRAQRRTAIRHERTLGRPVMLPAHHDVLIFRAPSEQAATAALSAPPASPSPLPHHPRSAVLQGRAAA